MRKILLTLAAVCATFMPLIAAPAGAIDKSDNKKVMLDELDQIRYEFAVKYAPADWKKKYAGWSLDSAIQQAKQKVLRTRNINLKQFQRIVKEFFNSTMDYHVSVHFYSTELAQLPFRVESAEGRFFVVSVDDLFASMLGLPLQIGDEILSFDGTPLASIVEQIKKKELGNPSSPTDQTFAEAFLTNRLGVLGHEVPHGDIAIEVRHKDGTTATYDTVWLSIPEVIAPPANMRSLSLAEEAKQKGKKSVAQSPFFLKEMSAGNAKVLEQARHSVAVSQNMQHNLKSGVADSYHALLGDKRGVLPTLGEVVWSAPEDSIFYAYIFKDDEGKNVGFIRLPTFAPESYEVLYNGVEEFKSLIDAFESQTDALIIDETNNPGGFVLYMYALASMLSDKPLKVPSEKLTLTQEDVAEALETIAALQTIEDEADAKEVMGETLFGYQVDLKFISQLLSYAQFIFTEWSSGRTFSNPAYVLGIDDIQPNATHYTKPIMVLVNQMDISCGDFFPAILQDNKRATIFGMKTAGAGGFVLRSSHPNILGISDYSYTGSIAQRIDGQPIENLGITPDIEYTPTAADYQKEYAGYKSAILKALKRKDERKNKLAN